MRSSKSDEGGRPPLPALGLTRDRKDSPDPIIPFIGPRSWPSLVALLIAAALILSSGLGYRIAAARYAALPTSAPLPPGTLAGVPLRIGQWQGRELPLEERIVRATDTDDHLSRRYTRPGGESVAIWVAYGVRLRDLMPHRPEVCYTGAGWMLRDQRRADVRATDGSILPCRMLTFRKSGLESQQLVVLNYYLVGDTYSHDVSSLRAQARRLNPDSDYVAQVQIVQQGGGAEDAIDQPACEFAAEVGPRIREVLDKAASEAKR